MSTSDHQDAAQQAAHQSPAEGDAEDFRIALAQRDIAIEGRDREAAKAKAMRAALDFAAGAIGDAIYTEDGLDGGAGQRVLHIITEARELGTFDQQQFGALDHLCPFTRAEKAEAALSATQPKSTRSMPSNALAAAVCTVEEARGFVAFGAGVYRVCQTVEPGLVVTFRRPGEEDRAVGERNAAPDLTPIPAEEIIVRLQFTSLAGLDSLEDHLREIRAEHWPHTVPSPAPAHERARAVTGLRSIRERHALSQEEHGALTVAIAVMRNPPPMPTNEAIEAVAKGHVGHDADFAADVLQRWGGWQPGLLGYGGSINATAQAPAVTHAWRPIDEAPKDGTEVWAFNGEQGRMKWIEGDGYALWTWADTLLSDTDPMPEQPTHFMSLPADPVFDVPVQGSGQ